MKRLLPQSLVGQMALLFAAALLAAQLVSVAYILVQRHEFTRAQIDAPAITRFTSTAADVDQASPAFQGLVVQDASRRGAHYDLGSKSLVTSGLSRREDTEERLRQSLGNAGLTVIDARAAVDPHPRMTIDPGHHHGEILILSAELGGGKWLNARLLIPVPPPLITPEIAVGTLLVYLFVLAAAVLVATRMARPLRDLTRAAEAFRGRNAPLEVKPGGPRDLRDAIMAFNAMNGRLVDLLEEKDRTLGAIGHDLRTPLASLRIRVETVEPEEDREKMVQTIEEMASTLEDILTLARVGRSREQFEERDVSALAEAISDDYRELGRPVTFAADTAHFCRIQPNLLRRAIRNLVDNALTYGGSALLEVDGVASAVRIRVSDDGEGLPEEELQRIAGAFYRSEPSRNRETGGVGLGLAISKAIADAHQGSLAFDNRDEGGLTATITLPCG